MVDWRHLIDLNPKAGDSWQGLTREQAKTLALIVVGAGLLLADPPFSIIPSDFLNLFIAGKIVDCTGVALHKALIFTYTFLAWGLIYIGLWIYPHNTKRLVNGTINKIFAGIQKAMKNPIIVIISLIIFYLIYQWYSKTLVVG